MTKKTLNLTRGLEVKGKYSDIDFLYGPYTTLQAACKRVVEAVRQKGLTVGIVEENSVVEYWWRDGITDSDLILKNPSKEKVDALEGRVDNLEQGFDQTFTLEEKEKLTGIEEGANNTDNDDVEGWGFTKNIGTVTKVRINGQNIEPSADGLVDLGRVDTIQSDSKLPDDYKMSSLSNNDLNLVPGESHNSAFSKLEKAINDDEEVIAAALNNLNNRVKSNLKEIKEIQDSNIQWTFDINSQSGYDTHNYKFSELKSLIESDINFSIKIIDNVDGFPPRIIKYINFGNNNQQYNFSDKSLYDIMALRLVSPTIIWTLSQGEQDSIIITVNDIQPRLILGVDDKYLLFDKKNISPSRILNIYATTTNGETTYQLVDEKEDVLYYQDFIEIINNYNIVFIAMKDQPQGSITTFRYIGRQYIDGIQDNPNENPPYQFIGNLYIDSNESLLGANILLQICDERNGFIQGVDQDIYFKFSTVSNNISNSYESPLSEGGITPNDSYEEAFRKLEDNIQNISKFIGEDIEIIPTLDNSIYYTGSDVELNSFSNYSTFTNSNKSIIKNVYLGNIYYYLLIPQSYNIKIITENNEDITEMFISKTNMTISNISYRVLEFHLSSNLPLDTNVTINITV